MKYLFLMLLMFGSAATVCSQTSETGKYIEVTGSAQMEVEPDEIYLVIGIEEYWKEEFQKKAEYKDYQTKVPLSQIQVNLFSDLLKLGIPKNKVQVQEVGNYFRDKAKEFLVRKQFELHLDHFGIVDSIVNTINTKGIAYMQIGALKNSRLADYRKQVKIEALKAAKEKADYLLQSVSKETGDILSIVELDEAIPYWTMRSMVSNAVVSPNDSPENNIRKIKLRYEIKARFEIR